jgi:nicotinamide mononucleotide transporter
MFEIIATVLGLIQGVLVMLNKRSNWLVYAAQMVALVIFSYQAKLYGDMWQNTFFFFFCLYSWFMWGTDKCSKISFEDNQDRLVLLGIIAFFTIAGGRILSHTDDPMPFTDSFTTTTTFLALYLMLLRKVEAWVVWFFNDVAYMYQYFYLPDQALYLFCLYIIWAILAVATFINWLRIYKKNKPLEMKV